MRVTDAELKLMADAQPTGPSWKRDVILELLEHRARIATHATAHPERLSARAIDVAIANSEVIGDAGLSRDEMYSALLEIQQRRAADLTEPQIDQVRAMLRDAVADRPIVCGPERIEILSDIIRAHGARP